MNQQANPQGKGLVPVMESLNQSRSLITPVAKSVEQISSELFTSLIVLHSRFQFKPVTGKLYWLYQRDNHFHISMIAPQEWGAGKFGRYVAECVLQEDNTWSLKLDEDANRDTQLMSMIERRRQLFVRTLKKAESINQILPYYMPSLPFYQRVFAAALAHSLQGSLFKSGLDGLSYAQAMQLQIKSNVTTAIRSKKI